MVSLRDRAAIVEKTLHQTAQKDGRECYVSVPIDAGAAAKARAEQQKASLMAQGNRVIHSKTRTSKLKRAEAFLISLQEGKVHVKRGVLTEENYNEIESFDGERKSRVHDDIIDALADAYTALTSGELIPSIRIPSDFKYRRRTHRRSPTRRTGKTLLS